MTTAVMLQTPRLLLRPLTLADEDDVFAYQSDPEVVRYIPWPVRTRDQVRAALERYAGLTRMEETGDGILLAIVEKTSGTVIGQLNLSIASREDRHGEFGYVVSRAFGRRGFATEASARLLDYAFDALDLHRATARIDARNVASAGVAQKLGLRCEAQFREDEWFKGEWTSTRIYAILADEWRALRGSMVTDERT
jgi:RimJ/RimL family protein N-acetyltransferase